jgi:hypothetical protein
MDPNEKREPVEEMSDVDIKKVIPAPNQSELLLSAYEALKIEHRFKTGQIIEFKKEFKKVGNFDKAIVIMYFLEPETNEDEDVLDMLVGIVPAVGAWVQIKVSSVYFQPVAE